MMCVRGHDASELTTWHTVAEALEAGRTLPCGPRCNRRHLIAWREGEHIRTCSLDYQRQPVTLAEALLAAGYHRAEPGTPTGQRPSRWPAPSSYNQPLTHTEEHHDTRGRTGVAP